MLKFSPREEQIVDIKTENEFYTEVFSWGSDRHGQLGLGIDVSSDPTYTIPRFCSYNITIKQVSCGLNHAGFVTCKSPSLFYTFRIKLPLHDGEQLARLAWNRRAFRS